MLARGFCRVSQSGTLSTLLTTNDFFGEESLLTDNPSPATVATITLVQVMVLEREHFEELLELYPQVRRALSRYTMMKQRQASANNAAQIAEKAAQLKRVRLEVQRTQHLLPADSRQRLKREIAAFDAMIKENYAATRRTSPAALSGCSLPFCRLRRSSCPGSGSSDNLKAGMRTSSRLSRCSA